MPTQGLMLTGSADKNIKLWRAGKCEKTFSGRYNDTTAKVWLNQRNVMTLTGHEAAVWAVALMPTQGLMLTRSADKNIKLWRAGKCEKTFSGRYNDTTAKVWLNQRNVMTLTGYEAAVWAVALMPTQRLMLTGSANKNIKLWRAGKCEKTFSGRYNDTTAKVWLNQRNVMTLTGHEAAVWAVALMPTQGLMLTGSADKNIKLWRAGKCEKTFSGRYNDTTAKMWLNQRNVMTLTGHEAAVWAVALMPTQGLMLTGSTDKNIKLWRAGKCEKTFSGHTDCVRVLAILSEVEFLSSSNDTTVRRWLTTGDCTHTYTGHTNFIYSIAILPNGQDFITSGEDRTVRVWEKGECSQTLTLPAQSIWCVSALGNGDIVAGSSDGMARVYSNDPDRVASPEALDLYSKQLASFTMPAKAQAFGGIKMEDLPGKKNLEQPGKRDDQTKLVRDGDTVEAYSWSASEGEWTKIGDVVGDKDSEARPSTSRVMYEGKEYDYVFDVDIEEGKTPLKLPFNTSDDPWHAAQAFIHKHSLSQYYLEQVANFIVDNTKGVTLGGPPQAQGVDPFTGAGRYIPGSAPDPNLPQIGSGGSGASDPFTGGSRYMPAGMDASEAASVQQQPAQVNNHTATNPFFPKTTLVKFDSANPQAILGKVKEFNSVIDSSMQMNDETVAILESLLTSTSDGTQGGSLTSQQIDVLWTLLQWPADKVFPAIDILCLAIRHSAVNQHFCNAKDGDQFFTHLLGLASGTSPPASRMLVFRTLCNAFMYQDGRQLMAVKRDNILSTVSDSVAANNKNMYIAMATVLLNFSVELHSSNDVEAKSQCLAVAATMLSTEPDLEACFRLLVSMGTLMTGDDNSIAIARSLEVLPVVSKLGAVKEPAKVRDCAKLVAAMLN